MSEHDNRLKLDERAQAVLDALPRDQRERLEPMIERATAHHRALLERALDDAVGMVPRPLRKRVQKLFLG